ncbi:MAG: hypothetical protein ABIP19_02600 [Dermatophilaceae bacterium]
MSTPHTTPAPVADYTRIVDDLAYHYDGVFNRETVQRAVDQACATLEPVSRIPAFLPILTERFAHVRSAGDIQARVTTLLGDILHQS